MSLTDLQIKRLKVPDQGQKTYFDASLRGFGVRVSQGGAKTFIVLLGKDRRRRTIGRYPDMSLSEARAIAKKAQADLLLDNPPHSIEKPKVAFSAARDRFLADCERRNKASTAAEYRRLLLRHFPFDGDLDDIERPRLSQLIEALHRTPGEQKHAFVAIRTMMNWCVKRGLIDASPVPPISFPVSTRSRILTDDELRSVWLRAEEYGYPYGNIVQLLILTGQRRGEIASLRRSWIREDGIEFPSGFTKNKREHFMPLGQRAREIIEGVPEGTELLFPARGAKDRPFCGWSKAKPAFDRQLDVPHYTLHDLRRTFSSNMARFGTPIHITERILNHVSGAISGVAAIYNRHSYRTEMRAAVDAYEAELSTMFANQNHRQVGK